MRPFSRRVPVRVTIFASTLVYCLLNGFLDRAGVGVSEPVLLALIGLAGAMVAGDTVRPSGMVSGEAP